MSSAGGLNKSVEVGINVTRLLRNLMNSLSCQPFARLIIQNWGTAMLLTSPTLNLH